MATNTPKKKKDKRDGLHPVLVRKLAKVMAAMEALGFPMLLTDGVRTDAEQQALYAIGRTKPGRIVTNADGHTHKSNHQPKADGYGYAADCCFLIDGRPSWDDDLPWETYGAACRAVGLRWGIKLNASTVDRPHTELPPTVG